ncbi:MAG: hypothetical protein HC906_01185 [Bacteroidales bacterium]|nr:hypothetical protein [Bacteroidales bacterium]
MKKLSLFIGFLLLCAVTFAQGYGDYNSPNVKVKGKSLIESKNLISNEDSLNYEMAYLRYNLYRFHKQHNTGISLMFVGFVGSTAFALNTAKNPDMKILL